MRKIDITTTQNVTIEYELATVTERAIAFLIDAIIIYTGTLMVFAILTLVFNLVNLSHHFYSFLLFVSFLYHVLFETLNHGQSLGKKLFKIRVVKINGERPDFFDFTMRTTFRLIDITASLGTLALICISSSEKGQRLGDFFADTTVVKLINIDRFSLSRILSMDNLKLYNPAYPEVIRFKEEEMLLIKETLERFKKYPNDHHEEAFRLLIKRIEEKLGIVAPMDKVLFLNTLIKDYVSLTR